MFVAQIVRDNISFKLVVWQYFTEKQQAFTDGRVPFGMQHSLCSDILHRAKNKQSALALSPITKQHCQSRSALHVPQPRRLFSGTSARCQEG